MALRFKDIDDWTPSSISIVDKPGHPMAVFEVYEDDDEFIKKYSPTSEVTNLTKEEKSTEETVTMPTSFFERFLGNLVSKSEPANESPEKPPVKDDDEDGKEDKLDKIIERLDSFDERLKKLENPKDPAPGAVQKSEGAAGDGGDGQGEGEAGEAQTLTEGQEESGKEEVVDDKKMVKKSQEVDPDLNKGSSAPAESFMKRIGRSEDGMKW